MTKLKQFLERARQNHGPARVNLMASSSASPTERNGGFPGRLFERELVIRDIVIVIVGLKRSFSSRFTMPNQSPLFPNRPASNAPSVALLHYTSWPVIGGVESMIRQHATLIADHGHPCQIFAGEGTSFSKSVAFQVLPELDLRNPLLRAAQKEVFENGPGAEFKRYKKLLRARLESALESFDCLIAHNLLTMPFNLAATQILADLGTQGKRLLAWVHDLAAINPDYSIPSEGIFKLLRSRQPGIRYVAISPTRAKEFRDLTGTDPDATIPNGTDLSYTLGLTPEVCRLTERHNNSLVLFYPTRILERKNIELTIRILAEMRPRQCLLMISGAPNPHHKSATTYLATLKRLAAELEVRDQLIWVNEHFFVDEQHLRSLYLISDAVLYPTRQEGFGLPLHEAAAFRIPIFCSNIDSLAFHLPENAVTFDLSLSPRKIAELILQTLEKDKAFGSRTDLRRKYLAGRIYREQIEPLIRSEQ